ncbi:hypothetical protein PR202_gb15708 [Eleusine coracana subsp. coracana]|uniref:Reverse transcriptase zinc-binding domain-containing protein n=1 Tax=Eleusine coracana subsp. coracana TaxID=191504 RepID=A0AAV5EYI5_ELECO|nr:hypothetical protein PR202_gb15708 [Eleusine coracana subsp. coracana]
MILNYYICELCILQKEETLKHLFLRCSFTRACWQTIGISFPNTLSPKRMVSILRRTLQVPFYMEIIITMSWCIWKQKNNWLFNVKTLQLQRRFQGRFYLGYP